LTVHRLAIDVARRRLRQTFHGANLSLWRRFGRNLSLSLGGAIVIVGIKGCQSLILTRTLRIEDYGRLLIIINLITFLNFFLGLRVSDLMFRFFAAFKASDNRAAVQGLLLVCFGISIVTGVVIAAVVFAFSPILAQHLCQSRDFAPLFSIYGCTALLTALTDVSAPVLRIYDRFKTIVVPQMLGGLVTFLVVASYIFTTDHYNLTVVITAFAVGVVVQTVPPLVHAFLLVRPYLADFHPRVSIAALAAYKPQLRACLFNSNMSGYLKIAVSPGDLFLLGIFCPPEQVALYGLAKQLIAPSALLATNVQFAITPEVTLLVADGKFVQLRELVHRYFKLMLVLGGLLSLASILITRFVVLRVSRPEYVASLPIFFMLLIAAWALLFAAMLRPLALNFDLLKWDNLAHIATALLLLGLILAGWLSGLTMAFAQLVSAVVLRGVFSLPVLSRLRDPDRHQCETTFATEPSSLQE
jgi:O-antigen/teichoic acid export membrane protein